VLLYLIENNKINAEYVKHYTNANLLVRDDFAFEDGLFSGYDAEKRQYDKSSWNYQFDENGYAMRDETLQHPRCVWNLLKQHVSRYTPEVVENICGTPKRTSQSVRSAGVNQRGGPNHHLPLRAGLDAAYRRGAEHPYHGDDSAAARQYGDGGRRRQCAARALQYSGANRFRPALDQPAGLPDAAVGTADGSAKLSAANTPKATLAEQVNYWSNYPKFFVSLMKSFYGDAAQKENDWGFHWLPKWDQAYDVIKYFNMMDNGNVTGYICQGFNPVASFPDKNKVVRSLSKLKYMVVIDPLVTETSTFWQNHGESNDVDPAAIQTEVFRLPSTCFAEEDGSIANSGRWLQWHWKGQDAPGEARNDGEILAGIYHRLREMYRTEGGKGRAAAEDGLALQAAGSSGIRRGREREQRLRAGGSLDANGALLAKKGQLLNSFALLRDDGTTASSCWIYTGSWTEQGNQMANRDNADPSGSGNTLGWAWAWPLNRRVLYNRASADINGKPWDAKRMLIQWNGSKWVGNDIPDFNTAPPGSKTGPFIMQPEGLGRLFALNKLAEGPFPEHYEPMETPLGTNPLHPNVVSSPVVRLYEEDALRLGKKANSRTSAPPIA
jgi:formate dehydrogenase-N alpha subunit